MTGNKSTNNNKRKFDSDEFSRSDDEIQLPLDVTLDYKSTCEFESISWESKRIKSIRIFVSRRWRVTHIVKIRTKIEISSIKIV